MKTPQEDERFPDEPRTAFHLRKRGISVPPLDDEELKEVPLVPAGTHLRQGATYIDLTDPACAEFKATADIVAAPNRAYVPKDRVPYEIWNRLKGKPHLS